jgi:integrase
MAQLINRGKNRWLVRVYLGLDGQGRARTLNKTIHGTKRDAERWAFEQEKQRDLLGPAVAQAADLTIGGLLADLQQDYRIRGRKSLQWLDLTIRKHLLPSFGAMPAAKLSTTDVRAFILAKQKEGLKAGTINRALAILRRALRLAAEADPPKLVRVPKIPELAEDPPRSGFFEEHEYRALLRALPDHLKPALAFGYWTGCRKGEILRLKWDQVDLDQGVVRLRAGETKSGEGRVVPLAPELVEILRLHRQRAGESEYVFTYNGAPFRDFRDGWEAACKTAGLWDEKTNRPTRLFHDLRRTAVRNLVRAGVPERVAQEISGHKTRAVFDRYNIVSETDLLSAARRLQRYLEEQRRADSHTDSHTNSDSTHTILTQRPGRVN